MCFSMLTNGQEEYPQDAFRSPLDIPLILAGTFGELRSNHFHSGIDIKTQQREGLPVYAIADGSVTRIKVSLWGYGKVMYVAHPNGYTSVYGHLQKFAPEIEEYIKKIQYDKKSYEVEVFPDYGEVKVEKGKNEKLPITKQARPHGMPIMLIKARRPKNHQASPINTPPSKNQIILPISLKLVDY